MLAAKLVVAFSCSLFVFSTFFSVSPVNAIETLTLSPSDYGMLTPGGVTANVSQIYFISGVKSVAYFTFNTSSLPNNAKVESIVLRVKTDVVFDHNWLSAYQWLGSWANYTWDSYTSDKETVGENNLIGSEWVDQMGTWYTYTFSSSDTIFNALASAPVTVDLECSYLGTNLPETIITIQAAQLVVSYTPVTPAYTPYNQSPSATSSPSGLFFPIELIVAITVAFILLVGIIALLWSRNKKYRTKIAK